MKINVELKNVTYNKHNNFEEIEITENGEYTASEGYDAISKANVNVEPNLEEIEITENGEYLPSEDKDGFSKIDVNVQPSLEELNVTKNGEYLPSEGKDGFSNVHVNVLNTTYDISINKNGEYTPVDGYIGFNRVNVNVEPNLEEIEITENGEYIPQAGFDGFEKVTVDVPDKPLETKTITENGSYTPSQGIYGFSEVNVNVQPSLEEKTITENGSYTPSGGYYGFSRIDVDIETYEPPLNIIVINPSSESSINLPITFQWNIDNLKQGETAIYYLFVDDVLAYKGENTSFTMNNLPIGGKVHKYNIIANTETRSGFTDVIDFLLEYEFNFGFDVNQDIDDPTDAVTYVNDCLNYTPAGLDDNNEFQFGSWKTFIDRICRPVMLKTDGTVDYELDHQNLGKKIDGTISDIQDIDYNGNAMVEFKKLYTKIWQEGNIIKVRISDSKLDSNYQAFAFVNDDGKEQNELYISMFQSISDENSAIKSIAVSEPYFYTKLNSITDDNPINTLDGGYGRLSYSILQFLRILHILISKSRDFVKCFGFVKNSGTNSFVLNKGGFSGNKSNESNVVSFYVQNLFSFYPYEDNITILDGIIVDSEGYYHLKNTRPYNKIISSGFDYSDFIRTDVKLMDTSPYYKWIKDMIISENILLPISVTNQSNNGYSAGMTVESSSSVNNLIGLSCVYFDAVPSIYGLTVWRTNYSSLNISTFITYIKPTNHS